MVSRLDSYGIANRYGIAMLKIKILWLYVVIPNIFSIFAS